MTEALFYRNNAGGELLFAPSNLFGLLPGPDIKIFLAKEGNNNSPIRELASSQRRKRLLRRLRAFVLEVNLANAVVLSRSGGGARHLDLGDGSVFGAFLFDVFENFCRRSQ